jgi:hypothetical protein
MVNFSVLAAVGLFFDNTPPGRHTPEAHPQARRRWHSFEDYGDGSNGGHKEGGQAGASEWVCIDVSEKMRHLCNGKSH